jgi:hypothetical protein
MALNLLDGHRRTLGVPEDTRPRCYHCFQLPDWCLCGGGPALELEERTNP